MKKSKALNIINLVDESRYAHWKLAVDEDCKNLKPALEQLGFRVLTYTSGLSDEDINILLNKNNVNFFITKNCVHFTLLRGKFPFPKYHLLCLSQVVLRDVNLLAKVIEGAIMYDSRLKGASNIVNINSEYITNLSKLKKQNKLDQKK